MASAVHTPLLYRRITGETGLPRRSRAGDFVQELSGPGANKAAARRPRWRWDLRRPALSEEPSREPARRTIRQPFPHIRRLADHPNRTITAEHHQHVELPYRAWPYSSRTRPPYSNTRRTLRLSPRLDTVIDLSAPQLSLGFVPPALCRCPAQGPNRSCPGCLTGLPGRSRKGVPCASRGPPSSKAQAQSGTRPAGGAAACCAPGEQQLENNRPEQQPPAQRTGGATADRFYFDDATHPRPRAAWCMNRHQLDIGATAGFVPRAPRPTVKRASPITRRR